MQKNSLAFCEILNPPRRRTMPRVHDFDGRCDPSDPAEPGGIVLDVGLQQDLVLSDRLVQEPQRRAVFWGGVVEVVGRNNSVGPRHV
jgi:hypothetical protein